MAEHNCQNQYIRVLGQQSMGANKSQVVDPNNSNPASNNNANFNKPNQQQQNEQMLQIIKQAFRNCSQNGMLTKDKFNQALSILEALGFKRLRDTPLADRLFYIFDKEKNGQIQENEFIKGIGDIISNQQNAINYTFRAYDKDGDNFISRKEYMQFIEQSWKAAFRLLSEGIDSNNSGIKIKDIQSWNSSKISTLNEKSSQIFNTISGGSDKADYQAFRIYILKGEINDITAQLQQKVALVPLNLSVLH